MKTIENHFRASDGELIFYHKFSPENEDVKYAVQIVHGMAEHSARYKEFAEFFTARGIAVYVNDHRGHGKTAQTLENFGVWDYKNAWSLVVDDIKHLNDIIAKENPNINIFILGHSMGSFLVKTFLTKYSSGITGAILTGTGYTPNYKLMPCCLFSRILCLTLGNRYRTKVLYKISFERFNKAYEESYEWLSRDKNVVKKYIDDPFCGGVFTSSFYKYLFLGIMYNNKLYNLKKIPKRLPIILLSGTGDPVGDYGRSVEIQQNRLIDAGIKKVDIKLYENARHEILNETNYKEVYQDIFLWMNSIVD